MNTSQIRRATESHGLLNRVTRGVCALDELPEGLPSRPCAFVVNTGVSTGPGKHWIALWFAEDGSVEMFDSYGRWPHRYGSSLNSFVNRNSTACNFQTRVLQHKRTRVCGQYCLYYLYHKCQGRTLVGIANDFGLDKVENDIRVSEFVEITLPTLGAEGGQSCTTRIHESPERAVGSQKKVTFADEPAEVHEWSDPDDKSHKQQWHLKARERMLVARRIRRAEKSIGPVFDPNYRRGWILWYRHTQKKK